MKRKLFSVMLMAVLLLLLAVVAAEASVIPGPGDGGTAPTAQFDPLAAPAVATGCTATGSGCTDLARPSAPTRAIIWRS